MPVICEYEASKDRETVEVRAGTETDTVIGAVICCEEPNCLSKAVSGVPKYVGGYGKGETHAAGAVAGLDGGRAGLCA